MRTALTFALVAVATTLLQADDAQPLNARRSSAHHQSWSIQLSTEDKSYHVFPDGTDWTEVPHHVRPSGLSPDGLRIVYIQNLEGKGGLSGDEIFVANADGTNAVQMTDNDAQDSSPYWTPNDNRLIFLSDRDGQWQVYAMNPDGLNVEQLTREPAGVKTLKLAPHDRFSYLALRKRQGKVWFMDLMLSDGKTSRPLVQNELLYDDYAWSPDEQTLVYGKVGALVFRDLRTGKVEQLDFASLDPGMKDHVVLNLAWRPDSQAFACQIMFFGGRQYRGPKMIGDEEIFVIPRSGKPTWFTPRVKPERFEWVRQKR